MYIEYEPFLCSRLSLKKLKAMEVRDFPSIYIFYSVVKIDDCDV